MRIGLSPSPGQSRLYGDPSAALSRESVPPTVMLLRHRRKPEAHTRLESWGQDRPLPP